ncbi:hypothetical protein RND81_11G080100 [Saponaria officinalis]|uniref:AP-5 complex subunit beta-1 n=1 Tax=Saponaria officinalis TaxID=3572 RepID=A0AAW1HJL0_SAPOF
MEKQPSKKILTTLSPQEFETLIDDFNHGDLHRVSKWTSSIPPLSLLHLSLSSLLKPSFPLSLKLHLLLFLDNHHSSLLLTTASAAADDDVIDFLSALLQTLKTLIQSPVDNVSITLSFKEQLLVSATSILMSIVDFSSNYDDKVRVKVRVEELVEVLLAVINRPNHGIDRQIRGVACECLRELEIELPGLLIEIVGHLWEICQNERTHACQSYLLLLLEVIHDIVVCKLNIGSVFSTAVPLVPFNVPSWLMNSDIDNVELSGSSLKELRRVVAFLLEWTQVLTPCGMVQFVSRVMPLAVGLELQTSLLKVQFGGFLYNYDPLLWHVVLSISRWFPDMYDGQESEICRRLVLISKEEQQPLVFRLLVLHWLLGFVGLVSEKDVTKRKLIGRMESNFYPKVYDALSLKAMKLDLLAFSCIVGNSGSSQDGSVTSSMTYLKDALVCVEAYKWLPPWSTETAVAFRTLHKFLIGVSSHVETDLSVINLIMQSSIFRSIQTMLVALLIDYRKLVPMLVSLVDRLLSCEKHCWLGQKLLQTLDEHLIPKISINYRLSAYFQLFDKIGKNDTIPPNRLLELLMKFTFYLVEKQGPDTGLKSWSQGSKVLGVCHTMLMHHHSSRLFMGLSRLLAFTSLYFPDLEVRDNARIYLRMLICIPGKKLRHILNLGDQSIGLSPSPHSSSLFSVQSPHLSQDLKKSPSISSYIHLERVIPLLVKQSWSLALPALRYEVDNDGFADGVKDDEPLSNGKDGDANNAIEYISDTKRIDHPQEPLRVMDSKISEIVDILRKHFSCIPDFRYMSGLKIRIPCNLRFESEPFSRVWGLDSSQVGIDELDACPAMYGIVLKFSSSAPYGSIPSCHIPILLGGRASDENIPRQDSKDIIPVGIPFDDKPVSKTPVIIELEPREPVPGLVDVSIDANAENGHVIRGKLQGVSVGIEDMFLNPPVLTEILEDTRPQYNSRLFDALWEACGSSSNSGRETFSMKGGKGLTAIYGTQSVKLLEVPPTFAIRVIERYLAPFVVSVIGSPLVDLVKDGGFIKNAVWIDIFSAPSDESSSFINPDAGPLYLTYIGNEAAIDSINNIGKTNMGCFLVLIFLPPRYHLLFRMEVSDNSTLVRIRTDHWPCLAYVDDYLEALFSS